MQILDHPNFPAPFEFSFNDENGQPDMERVPIICQLVTEWCDENFGEDINVAGVLFFTGERELVGLRVEICGPDESGPDDDTTFANGEGAWQGMIAFAREVDGPNVFLFVRRTKTFGHGAKPGLNDLSLHQTTEMLSEDDVIQYHGMILTDGIEYGFVVSDTLPSHRRAQRQSSMIELLRTLGPEGKAAVGRDILARVERDPDADPEIIKVLKIAIEHFAANEPVTDPGEVSALLGVINKLSAMLDEPEEPVFDHGDLLRQIEAKLHEQEQVEQPGLFDLPPTPPKRPDVPDAFYH